MDSNDVATLIERIRETELSSVRSERSSDRLEHSLDTLDERGTAQTLIQQQHTRRYPFELLQNADDASKEVTGDTRVVHFELTASALIVADCGVGFGENQVRAICC